MQDENELYLNLSNEEYRTLLFARDTQIRDLLDSQFTDRQTLREYREIIWGKKSEKHIRSLAIPALDASAPEIPFHGLPEIETTVRIITPSPNPDTLPTRPLPEKKSFIRRIKPTGRKKLSATLPREYVEILPENYQEGLIRISSEETEELDYRPGSFFVRVISRPRFLDPGTKKLSIAPLPARPIHKASCGAGLLAYILLSRFGDHLPYYRQVKMLNRYGENIVNTSTVGFWVRGGIQLLTRIYTRIQQKIVEADYLLGDETTLKVLDRYKALGKHLGYIWGYLAPLEKLVYMEYQEGRAAEYPEAFLKNYSGVFQTDAYGGYDKLGTEREGITHIACWAHARRNFFKAEIVDKVRAAIALELIGELYRVEAKAKEQRLNYTELTKIRLEQSVPILQKIKDQAETWAKELNPKSTIRQACMYMLKRWDKLTYYATDGRIQIDNNLLENRFRGVALGRKNWLFAGNHESAERSAIIYSILESCALNNVEPFAYLQDVLTRLPYLQFAPDEMIDPLLPNHWKPQANKIYIKPNQRNWQQTG